MEEEKKKCLKCGAKLTGKQVNYCSEYHGKLYLKSQYRKRNLTKIAEYNREYRKHQRDTVSA